MATDQTRAEAADPNTAAARLQELATADRELWPLIAANPTAYPALLDWMGEHGDDEVRSVIASRGTEATSVLPPTAPPTAPPTGSPTAPMAAAGAMPPPPGQTPPGQPFPGQPFPGQPFPGQPLGAPAGQHGNDGKSKKGLWITLAIVIGLLLASGIGVGVWALTKGDGDDKDDTKTSEPAPTDEDEDDEETKDPDDEETSGTDDETCDVINDVEEAAFDVYLFIPGLDDVGDLDDAVAVLEDNHDAVNDEIGDAMDVLIDYADVAGAAEDFSDVPTEDEEAASDAYDEIFEFYLDC